uniref:Uncharacterized protein n=1 Tax=Cannabis sativa TaxID=3483 RepID=A0A803PSX7_CANSA
MKMRRIDNFGQKITNFWLKFGLWKLGPTTCLMKFPSEKNMCFLSLWGARAHEQKVSCGTQGYVVADHLANIEESATNQPFTRTREGLCRAPTPTERNCFPPHESIFAWGPSLLMAGGALPLASYYWDVLGALGLAPFQLSSNSYPILAGLKSLYHMLELGDSTPAEVLYMYQSKVSPARRGKHSDDCYYLSCVTSPMIFEETISISSSDWLKERVSLLQGVDIRKRNLCFLLHDNHLRACGLLKESRMTKDDSFRKVANWEDLPDPTRPSRKRRAKLVSALDTPVQDLCP